MKKFAYIFFGILFIIGCIVIPLKYSHADTFICDTASTTDCYEQETAFTEQSMFMDLSLDSFTAPTGDYVNLDKIGLLMSDYPDTISSAVQFKTTAQRRDVFSFLTPDLSGASIDTANVCITTNGGDFTAGGNVDLHALNHDFTNSQVSWNKYNSTTNWATAGGDYSSTVLDTVDMALGDTTYCFDVSDVVTSENTRYGFIGVPTGTGLNFSIWGAGDYIPYLEYTTTEGGGEGTTTPSYTVATTTLTDVVYTNSVLIFLLCMIFFGLMFNSFNPK